MMEDDKTDPRFAALGEALAEALVARDEALVERDAYCASLREARAEVERLRAEVEQVRADVALWVASLLDAIGERDRMAGHRRTGGEE